MFLALHDGPTAFGPRMARRRVVGHGVHGRLSVADEAMTGALLEVRLRLRMASASSATAAGVRV